MEAIDRRLASGWGVAERADDPSRISHESGISSSAGFLDTPRGRLFTVLHEPAEPPDHAVVVCSPLLAEAIRSQRRELVLGWELSGSGASVMRFHYVGSGNSDGEPENMTFAGLVADARVAATELRERTGISAIGFVGTRLGALVAAAAAAEFPGGSLVLWEPPIDMGRYYNEVFRARMIGLLKRGERSLGSKELMEVFARDGVLDVIGNPLPHSLYQTTVELDLADLLVAAGPRPALVVQMSIKPELRPGLTAVLERCEAAGMTVGATATTYDESWWFGATGHTVVEVESGALDAIPVTTRFLLGDRS